MVRFHGGALPAYVVSSILLAYGGQLYSLLSTGKNAHALKIDAVLNFTAEPFSLMSFSLADFVLPVLESKASAQLGHVYLGYDGLEGIIRTFLELTTTLGMPE